MSDDLFPILPGFSITVSRSPVFNTQALTAMSGKEFRIITQYDPRWKYTLKLEFLRTDLFDDEGDPLDELSIMELFFLAHQGKYDTFLYPDPYDQTLRRVRFDMDDLETTRILAPVWEAKTIKLISVLGEGLIPNAPNPLGYPTPYSLELDVEAYTASTDIGPGGARTHYGVVQGALPIGLTISMTTGVITGTPTLAGEALPFTVRATNAFGHVEQTLHWTVVDPAIILSLGYEDQTLTVGTPAYFEPTPVGGPPVLYEVVNDDVLPDGLVLDPNTGIVTGTPTGEQGQIGCTLRGSNPGSHVDQFVLIEVLPV